MKALVAVMLAMLLGLAAADAAVLYNSSFETQGSSADYAYHWEFNNPDSHGGVWGSSARENWRAHSGTWEATVRGTWAGAGDSGGWWQELAAAPLVPYRASAWFWADNNWTADTQELRIEFYNSSGTMVGGVTNSFASPGESWKLISVDGQSPNDTAWARFVVAVSGAGANGSLQFDDAGLGAVPEPAGVSVFLVGILMAAGMRRRFLFG